MTISFDVAAEDDWFSPVGELRRHAQLLIVNRSIAELVNRCSPRSGGSGGLTLNRGVFLQTVLFLPMQLQRRLFVNFGIIDQSGLVMRLALSVHAEGKEEDVATCLFSVHVSGDQLAHRRLLSQIAATRQLSWIHRPKDAWDNLFPYVPLSDFKVAHKGLLWTSLCQP